MKHCLVFLLLFALVTATYASLVSPLTFSFGGTVILLESHINVPFYYQDKYYYCGPTCLQMVFKYYGENISQSEIACVARTIGDPVDATFTDELRRAGHFSNLSTSMGDELPNNITGYTLRSLGYAAFESQGMNLSTLEDYISQGKPLILLMWYSSHHVSTHYRVAVGYNQTHVFLHDPWNKPVWNGTYGGPNIAFNNTQFLDLWSYYGNYTLYVCPWTIKISAPTYIKPEAPFQIESTITYPQPPANALSDYPASSCNVSITLPANLSLVQGEVQKKPIGTGLLNAVTNATVSWTLVANSSINGIVSITAEGKVSGSVGTHYNYTTYNYTDRIGATVSFAITLNADISPPTIDTLSRVPVTDVQPNQAVKISTNVTDPDSGVQNVTLYCTINNETTWENETMSLNQTTKLYEATIPGQQAGTWVRFKIFACDKVGNNVTLDGAQSYCTYQTVPEFPLLLVLPLFMTVTLLAIMTYKRKRTVFRALPCSKIVLKLI